MGSQAPASSRRVRIGRPRGLASRETGLERRPLRLPAWREKRIADAVSRVQAVAVSGISPTVRNADGAEPYSAFTDLLIGLGVAAEASGQVMALIYIDEIQNITDEKALSQLLIVRGDALVHEIEVPVRARSGEGRNARRPLTSRILERPTVEERDFVNAMAEVPARSGRRRASRRR